MPLIGTRRTLLVGSTYMDRVLGMVSSNLIGYWPMNEGSGSVAVDWSKEKNNGAYTGVTLGNATGPDLEPCPYFDKTSDYNNVNTAGLIADFDGAEGTMMCWAKVNASAVWVDNAERTIMRIENDGGDQLLIRKAADNDIDWTRVNGGTDTRSKTATPTAWTHLALTWSETGDWIIAYYNGVQEGATISGVGTWTGTNNLFLIGAGLVTGAVWHGWLAHAAIWDRALKPAQIADLAVV